MCVRAHAYRHIAYIQYLLAKICSQLNLTHCWRKKSQAPHDVIAHKVL